MMLESATRDKVLGQWGLREADATNIENQIDRQILLMGPKTVAEIYLQKHCACRVLIFHSRQVYKLLIGLSAKMKGYFA